MLFNFSSNISHILSSEAWVISAAASMIYTFPDTNNLILPPWEMTYIGTNLQKHSSFQVLDTLGF